MKKIVIFGFIVSIFIVLIILFSYLYHNVFLVHHDFIIKNKMLFFILLLLIVVFFIQLIVGKNKMKIKNGKRSDSSVHGDADFFNRDLLKEYFDGVNYDYQNSKGGWLVTDDLKTKKSYWDNSDIHQLISAPTGSGKTTKISVKTVIYNLIAGVNIVAIDPKNTFYRLTSSLAKSLGYKTVIINFKDTTQSEQWNMLDKINYYTDKMMTAKTNFNNTEDNRDYQTYLDWRSRMEQQVDELTEKIIVSDNSKNENEFFVSQNRNILKSLIILVSMYGGENRNFGSVVRLLDEMLLSKHKNPFNYIFANSEILDNTHPALNSVMLESGSDETFSNIKVSVSNALAKFKLIGLHRLLASNTFEINDLVNKKCILYVVVPETTGAAATLATIFIDQLITQLTEIADNEPNKTLDKQVRFVFEELANGLDKLEKLDQYTAIVRSRNILFSFIIQDLEQLNAKYGKEQATTIKHNCNLINILQVHCLDMETAKLVSERNGEYTTESGSKSISINNNSSSDNVSYTDQLTAKNLTKVNEVMELTVGLTYKTGSFKPIQSEYLPYYSKLFPFDLTPNDKIDFSEQKDLSYFSFEELTKALNVKEKKKEIKKAKENNEELKRLNTIYSKIEKNMTLSKNENSLIEPFKKNKELYAFLLEKNPTTIRELESCLRIANFNKKNKEE